MEDQRGGGYRNWDRGSISAVLSGKKGQILDTRKEEIIGLGGGWDVMD